MSCDPHRRLGGARSAGFASSHPARWPLALAFGLGLALPAATSAQSPEEELAEDEAVETAWVQPEARINFRAAPSPDATPLGIVRTGDEVKILERREGWVRVEVEGGHTGWLPERQLARNGPLRRRIAALEAETASLRADLAASRLELRGLEARNQQLEAREREREVLLRELEEENRDLRAGERWPYLITGASILGLGMTVGFLLRGGSSARRGGSRIRL